MLFPVEPPPNTPIPQSGETGSGKEPNTSNPDKTDLLHVPPIDIYLPAALIYQKNTQVGQVFMAIVTH
jgi:hypothetical protein